jgi:hypothetical protein
MKECKLDISIPQKNVFKLKGKKYIIPGNKINQIFITTRDV